MATAPSIRATLDDLARVDGKAELIDGRIVHFMATGHLPSQVAGAIFVELFQLVRRTDIGNAYADNTGFAVPRLPSGRESFSPDAAYYDGPLPANPMRFVPGPPTFAVEVRSENDYGPRSESERAAKRADYFAAGTLVVWDVDPITETIHVYRADAPQAPATYRRGDQAEAEPALPGWRVDVAAIFRR